MNDILKDLRIKEKFELRILKKYDKILYKTFQVIYEADGVIEWERIYRFSPTSNFVMIAGNALISAGQTLSNGQKLDNDTVLEVSFTIPWKMLEDGSTAYQIADAAKTIFTVRPIIGAVEFHSLLRDESFTFESMQEYLPDVDKLEKMAQEEPEIKDIELPKHLQGFKLEDLTDKQKESLMLNEIGKTL